MTKIKNLSKIILINIFILLLLILVPEGTVRLLYPAKEARAIFNDKELRVRNRPFVEHHPQRGFALKPGFRNAIYTIDSDGFRGEGLPKGTSRPYTILTMGESTTFGWGVDDNATYPRYLMQALSSTNQKPYVVNGGVPSYTSSQVRIYLDEILDKKAVCPDLILVNIMWNDIWYSTVKNWHKEILVYQKPPNWIVWLNKHSRLFTLIVEKLNPKEKTTVDRYNAQALEYYAENLEYMAKRCKEQDIPLVFIEPPFDADHMPEAGLNEFGIRYTKPFLIETAKSYREAMHEVARKYHIPVISHRLGIQNLHQKRLFLDALHPTAEGNRMMGEDIGKQIAPLLIEDIPL